MRFEWRVCWHAGIVGSDGSTYWELWEGDEQTEDEVRDAADHSTPGGSCSLAEEYFWNASGVEFWTEVRTVASEENDQ